MTGAAGLLAIVDSAKGWRRKVAATVVMKMEFVAIHRDDERAKVKSTGQKENLTQRRRGNRDSRRLLRGKGVEVGLELVEGAGEALVEGVAHGFEEIELLVGGVERLAEELQSGEIELLRESERHKDFKRPLRVEGRAGGVALGIREGIDEDETVRGENFAVGELAPHFLVVGRAKAVKELAAGAEVHLAEADGAPFWSPPAAEMIGIGPEAEDEFARRVEHAGDGESVMFVAGVRRLGGWGGGGHNCSLWIGLLVTAIVSSEWGAETSAAIVSNGRLWWLAVGRLGRGGVRMYEYGGGILRSL